MRAKLLPLLAVLLAVPAAAQEPDSVIVLTEAEYDSLMTEAVRARGFVRGSETQLTKFLDLAGRLKVKKPHPHDTVPTPPDTVPGDTVITDPNDSTVLPPPDTTGPGGEPNPPPELADGVAFLLGPVTGLSPWPRFDQMFRERLPVHHFGITAPDATGVQEKMYYDAGQSAYTAFYRYGDSTYLRMAREIVQVWKDDWLAAFGTSVAPRSVALTGLMVYALDMDANGQTCTVGTYTCWEYVEAYIRRQYQTWLGARLNYETLHYGLRDGGYTLQFTAGFARVAPTQALRDEFRQMALVAARDYYARLQYPDGGWYWGDSAAQIRVAKTFNADGTPATYWRHSQGFMVGLALDGLIMTHQLTGDTAVARAIIKGTRWIHEVPYRIDDPVPDPYSHIMWRGQDYFVLEPGAPIPTGADDPRVYTTQHRRLLDVYPDYNWACSGIYERNGYAVQGTICLRGGSDFNSIRDVRQHNCVNVHAFGYAYWLTGDESFLTMGDEIFSATFGAGEGPGADAAYALQDYGSKSFNQCYARGAPTYLSWRTSR